MAYATTNPPALSGAYPIAASGRRWVLKGTDAAATVDTAGYITNAKDLGMLVGDLVEVHKTDASPYTVTLHSVLSIAANGSANLSDAGATMATNTD